MACQTPNDHLYSQHMDEQLKGMLRHLEGKHEHPTNTWYEKCRHTMPYLGIPMDPGNNPFF